ncbi:hypothetical protein [Sandaracinus amylolyticus]|uniref:Uncharacterized protein n=1 Tax=Sandaracinus amylolyticus TaxID=927083 RepID=A0A0F6W6G3_9BACT|nr:hypothetical protein [Sandaracinus amylolyticus]AKF08521.1 hypothetical protein DB32_005670 [Sandaracinus amylolyticus]
MSPSLRPSPALVRTLFLVIVAVVALAPSAAPAQRRPRGERRERPVPADATVQWTVFVSAHGDQPARRTTATAEPGSIEVPMSGWQCTYSAPNRAQLNETNWSEVRTLECTHGDAVVSTTGFCQIAGASWGARAGVLALGSRTDASRVTVTLDCAVLQ